MKSQVWVWAEHYQDEVTRASLGLVGKARELCGKLGGGEVAAVLAGAESREMANTLIGYGADKVYTAGDASLTPFDTECQARFVAGLARQHQPDIFLWGATSLGHEVAARAAAILGTGLVAHCVDLDVEELQGERVLVGMVAGWGGNLTLKNICPRRRPQMATVRPGIFNPPEKKERRGEIIPVKADATASRVELVEVIEEKDKGASLDQAEVVVVAGWGLNAAGGIREAEKLATALGGGVAGTRPALDAGWVPHEGMIGQSGRIIAPRLLITLGASGAAQFTTGIMDAGFVLAVDRNPDAPIFEMADIGIVGDLREVLPLLVEKITETKKVEGRGK